MADLTSVFGSIAGKVAVVTGGASGIGAATAKALAEAGAEVRVWDRDLPGAEKVVADIVDGGHAASVGEVDLSELALPATVARLVEEAGNVDILVNCAGIIQRSRSMFDITDGEWALVQRVNLEGPFVLAQSVARSMVERGAGGRIVNVSSAAAFRAVASPAAYAASKAGLVALTRSMAAELAPFDINVNAVAPGVTETPIYSDADVAAPSRVEKVASGPLANLFARVTRPEEVAAAIVFLCLPASRQITAQTLHVSGGAIV